MLFEAAGTNGGQVETAASEDSYSQGNRAFCPFSPEHLPLKVVLVVVFTEHDSCNGVCVWGEGRGYITLHAQLKVKY